MYSPGTCWGNRKAPSANSLLLALPASENPIHPDRPQNAQIVALLAIPWQVDAEQLDITTLGALLACIHERSGPLTPWHCVLVEQSLETASKAIVQRSHGYRFSGSNPASRRPHP